MAQADLGVRVFLIDSLTSPMGLLTTSFSGLLGIIGSLADRSNQLGDAWLNAVSNGMYKTADDIAAKMDAVNSLITGFGVVAGAAIDWSLFYQGLSLATQDASQLQDSLANLSIGVKGAAQDMGDITSYLFSLGSKSIYSTDQITQGIELLGEKGYSASQILQNDMGTAVVDLAEAIGDQSSGTTGAANLLASAMELYSANAKDAQKYADLLTYAFYNGIPSVSQLQGALEQVGGRANLLKVPFDQLVVTLDQLGRAGLTGSEAGSALNYFLTNLSTPTAKAQAELETLGIIVANSTAPAFHAFTQEVLASESANGQAKTTYDGSVKSLSVMFTAAQNLGLVSKDANFYQWAIQSGVIKNNLFDAQGHFIGLEQAIGILSQKMKGMNPEEQSNALQNIFNVRSGRAAPILVQNLSKVQQKLIDLNGTLDAHGLAAKDATTRTDTLSAKQKELGTTFTDFMAQSGGPFTKFLTGALGGLNSWLGSIVTKQPMVAQFFGTFLEVGNLIAPLVAFGAIFTIIGDAADVLGIEAMSLLTPVLLVAAGIMAVSLVVAGLLTYWKQIVGFWTSSNPILLLIKSLLVGIGAAILANVLPPLIALGVHAALTFVQWAAGAVTAGAASLLAFAPIILAGVALGAVIFGVVLLIQHWGTVMTWLGGMVKTVSLAVVDAWVGFAGWMYAHVIAPVVNFFVGMGQHIASAWNTTTTTLKNAALLVPSMINVVLIQPVVGFFRGLITSIVGIWDTVTTGIHNAIVGLPDWVNQHVIQPIVGFFGWLLQKAQDVLTWVSNNLGMGKAISSLEQQTIQQWQAQHPGQPLPAQFQQAAGLSTPSLQYAQSSNAGGNSSPQTTTVNLNLDGKQLAQATINHITGQLQLSGTNRMLR